MFQELRVRAGLSQREVADAFGDKSAQFCSNWERGLCPVPVKRLPKLAKLYRVPLKTLFNRFMKERRIAYLIEMTSK